MNSEQHFILTEVILQSLLFKDQFLGKQYGIKIEKKISDKIMTFRKDIKIDENIPF
jgi:hypothetical protein